MSDNIISMPTPKHVLAERLRSAHQRKMKGRAEWIEGTADEAVALAEGRGQYPRGRPGDTAFGIWLTENDLDYWGNGDRAAMINLGKLARDDLLFVLDTVADAKWKPDTIWRMLKQKQWEYILHRFNEVLASDDPNLEIPPDPSQVIPIAAPVEQKQTVAPEAPAKTEVHVPIKRKDHPFFGLSRAEEVAAIYCQSKTRLMVGSAIKKQRAIWPLILQMIDAGILGPSNAIREHPDLSILFPEAPLAFRRKYILTKAGDLRAVRERIIPAALANRELIAAEPANIEDIIGVYWRQLQEKAHAEQRASKIEAAMAAMKAAETEVILFGRRYWPIVEQQPHLAYDFATLRHAVWTFRELHTMSRLASDNSPASCGLRIRHAIKFLNGYADKTILWLLSDLSRALQSQPDGIEKLPDMPNLDKSYD